MSCGQNGAILPRVALRHVHQPLHAGYAGDRGGNKFKVQAFGRGTNLHAMWDTGRIQNLNQEKATLTSRLLATPVHATDLNAARACEESVRIVGTPGFYPDRIVGSDHIERFTPSMEHRLALAAILNRHAHKVESLVSSVPREERDSISYTPRASL